MAKTKNGLSNLEIAAKLKAGKPFDVHGEAQRKRVLNCAQFIELPNTVTTRGNANGKFTVLFVPKT